jgi:hypothetical protein
LKDSGLTLFIQRILRELRHVCDFLPAAVAHGPVDVVSDVPARFQSGLCCNASRFRPLV